MVAENTWKDCELSTELRGWTPILDSSAFLFKFPRKDEMKKRWIDFVESNTDGELRITTNTRLQ